MAADLIRTELFAAMNSAQFVKRARAKLKLTQAELADKLGLERRSIMRFEKGDELPIQTRLAIKHLITRHNRLKELRAARGALPTPSSGGKPPTKATSFWA